MKTYDLKNNKGFTLVEVIISIAVLAFISAIVLKLFVLSSDVSEKARIKDVASVYASNAIEICKQLSSPKEISETSFFENAEFINEGGYDCVLYYDKHWQVVPGDDPLLSYKLILNLAPNTAYASLDMPTKLTDSGDTHVVASVLYDLSVRVEQLDDKTMTYGEIVHYSTSKYYVYEE